MTVPRFTGRSTPELALLIGVAEALGPLVDQVVFIGGAIAPLLQTHPISPRVRPTKDVDGVAITATYAEFTVLQEQLRARGFLQLALAPDATKHAHRWTTPSGSLFDLVAAGSHFGGSGNPVDQAAVDAAVSITLPTTNGGTMVIRHADAPAFIALKWAAYGDRGGGDLLGSHDVEDILAVIASRPQLAEECARSTERVRGVVRAMADALLSCEDTLGEVLQAHVVVNAAHDPRRVHQRLKERLHVLRSC